MGEGGRDSEVFIFNFVFVVLGVLEVFLGWLGVGILFLVFEEVKVVGVEVLRVVF